MPLSAPSPPSFESVHISIPLGIFIGLIASFIQSLGLTIQRKSHVINQSLPKHRQQVEHRRPLWLLGFGTFIISNLIGSFVQIASLPVVILAPLGAVSLLWNAFFARLILGDVFSPWMIIGTILIAGGASLIGIFGIVSEPTHSLEDLLELFRRPAFAVYFSLLGMTVFLCLAVTHIGEVRWVRKLGAVETHCPSSPTTGVYAVEDPSADITLSNTTSTFSNVSTITEVTPLLDRKNNLFSPSGLVQNPSLNTLDRTRVLLSISYASISGIISGMCLIFAKSGVELLLLTFGGKNQFRRWESWILVGGLIIFALLQMWYLHKALILANPTLVCPSAFCFYNLSSIVNGLVYFNQIQLIKAFHLGLVGLGIVILLGGVWVVSIHSGGGGVDVGTWNEESGDDVDDPVIVTSGVEEEDPSSDLACQTSDYDDLANRSISTHKPFGPIPISRHTQSEPLQATLATTSQVPEAEGSYLQRLRAEHRNTMYSTGPLLSPPSFRTTFAQRRSTMASDTQHSSLSLHRRDGTVPPSTLSPPWNTTVSTLGAGLRIGLSPVSPGFAIVPRGRKRRTSGPGTVDSEQGPGGGVRSRARSVSEGAFNSAYRAQRDLSFSDPGIFESRRPEEPSPGTDIPQRERRKWMWLKKIFSKPQRQPH